MLLLDIIMGNEYGKAVIRQNLISLDKIPNLFTKYF